VLLKSASAYECFASKSFNFRKKSTALLFTDKTIGYVLLLTYSQEGPRLYGARAKTKFGPPMFELNLPY